MELNIRERIGIIQLLPSDGDYDEMEMVESIDEKVNILGQEQQDVGLHIDQQGFPAWTKDKTRKVELTKGETEFIKGRIRNLHERKQITQFMFKAVKRFGKPLAAKDPA